jgi:SAM-dependent methyltransferase
MRNARLYLPLVGFVVPTVVIGYGVVIPRSCIAGVNELTVGFAGTIVGAALTYVAGVRSAAAAGTSAAMPWRRRVERYINRQAASPRGLFGHFLGLLWGLEHRAVNRATLELLAVEPGHRVLEVGCGPGVALEGAAERACSGEVVGVDVSDAMVSAARKHNRQAIERGHVTVRRIDGVNVGAEPSSFDRIFSVHCLYFWKDPGHMLSQLFEALRPGGRLVLAFRPAGPEVPARFRDDEAYRFYEPAELEGLLARAGFVAVRTVCAPGVVGPLRWAVAERGVEAVERGPTALRRAP